MAAVHAGMKRSHYQMRGESYEGSLSLPSSREQSPKAGSPFRSAPGLNIDSGLDIGLDSRPRRAVFDPSASIVLVGLRGTGKSSLGVIAAAAYNYRLIETQRSFIDSTGQLPSEYRVSHGRDEFQRRNRGVLDRILRTYSEKAVIVCSFTDLEHGGASLLQDYAQSHAVIHVTRDSVGLHAYFKTWTLERVSQLLLASGPILRSCSNFEFFNLSEELRGPGFAVSERNGGARAKHLTLKRVERDFLRLLRNIIGDHGRSIAHHSAYPLSQIDVERRYHTFALRLTAAEVLQAGVDLETAQIGADCVELLVGVPGEDGRGPLLEVAKAFAIIRRNSILPIWVSVHNDPQPSKHTVGSVYGMILHCLSFGPELCSVDTLLSDAQIQRLVENKSSTKLVALATLARRPSLGWRDPMCADIVTRAARFGCDMVKVTMPAGPTNQWFEAKAFCAEMERSGIKIGMIAYEEGPEGRPSQCANDVLTTVHSPASGNDSAAKVGTRTAITARSINKAMFAGFALDPMHFYIYGRDVSYSLSPAMSNAAYAACGMEHDLTTFDCHDLEGLRNLIQGHDFGGAAILQPFKAAVMPMLNGVSSHARAIGAVNTVIPIRVLAEDGAMPSDVEIIRQRNRQGQLMGLYGTNTDWIGIRSCVRRGLSPANSIRASSTGLICGAGGMARAAIHSLASLGCQNIFICNRTPKHAHALARHYNSLIEAGDIPELGTNNTSKTRVQVIESLTEPWPSGMRQPTMIVCCVPADDATGIPINFTLPKGWLESPTGGVVVEIAYKRPLTPLISQVRALADQGWNLYDGFDVLPEQAYAQFEVFTGRRAPRKLMKDQVLKHYHAMTSTGTSEPG